MLAIQAMGRWTTSSMVQRYAHLAGQNLDAEAAAIGIPNVSPRVLDAQFSSQSDAESADARLYFGRAGECLVRYDNEAGKGDHRHVQGLEESYRFVSVAKLRRDFEADILKYGGGDEEED
jgi:hypothetical protein